MTLLPDRSRCQQQLTPLKSERISMLSIGEKGQGKKRAPAGALFRSMQVKTTHRLTQSNALNIEQLKSRKRICNQLLNVTAVTLHTRCFHSEVGGR
jgi:hypothetical protein